MKTGMKFMNRKTKTKYAALAVCLFIISFWIGYFYAEFALPHTVTATIDKYNQLDNTLTLIDENGELWAFCDVSEPPKDFESCYKITYKGWFKLLKLETFKGQEISFV